MQQQISISLETPCQKCQNQWGELKENKFHAAGLYCKNCGICLKWVGNGEELKAVIQSRTFSASIPLNQPFLKKL